MSERRIPCQCCEGQGYIVPPYTAPLPPQIVRDAGVVGGDWRIEGTRITVKTIQAVADGHGRPVESIVWLYPVLTEEHVAAALAWDERGDNR